MLTMLLGTDWTANRDSILNMIARDVSEEKRNRILIVPELISHDTERRLCVSAGDTCSRFAEVLSFTRLFDRVMETIECGVQECLDNGGRVVAMAAAVRNLHSKLKSYASVETRPEFLIGLVDAIDEFKRCCITAQELLWASRQTEGIFAQKLEELSLIFDAYEAFCQRGKRDPRDQMTWLLEQLEDCDFARDHVFYIDGFPDFTRQHAAILEHLIVNAEHVIISMNCDEVGSLTPGFERAGATAASLISYAKSAQIPVNVKQVAPNIVPLQIMRENLFQGRIQADIQASECLRVYQTETVYEECLAAAEQIMTLVRSGVRYRDINIVCADMNIYRDPLRTVMNRCKIPIYLSGTEDILNRPVITTVLAAIDAALGGFEQQETMRYLKSALSPLTLDACDKLENYAIRWGINGSEWTKEWTKHPEGLGEAWTEETLSDLMNLNRIRKNAIEPLEGLCRDFRNATNLRQQILAVYRFLEQIQFAERLSELADDMDKQGKNSDAQVLNQLWEILLTALEQMYDVLGETVWDADTFARLLRLLLSQYDVGTIPSVLDSVTIGPVSAMRCQQVDHLIVLGALEGALPGYSGSAGVFTDQERTALRHLGVPLTGGALDGLQISFSEIYGVFCGAQKSVSVSCPAGQASFLFRRLRDLAGGVRPVEVTFGAARADKIEAAAFLAAFGDKETAQKLGLKDAYEQIDEKKNYQFGTVTNENVVKLYGACLNLSASQIDKHADCRFSYFLKYGLRLK